MSLRQFVFEEGDSAKFWSVERRGNSLVLGWGRIGSKGQSKIKAFASPAAASKEYERLLASKQRDGYVEGAVGTKKREDAVSKHEKHKPPKRGKAAEVAALLVDLRARGASVETAPTPPSDASVRASEQKLGFGLPKDYREFLVQFGYITVRFGRPWFFYGLDFAVARADEYSDEFQSGEDGNEDRDGPYYPKRFIVLCDSGVYSNAGEGLVYDADRRALFGTAGRKYVSRPRMGSSGGYWDWVIRELERIRDLLAPSMDAAVPQGDTPPRDTKAKKAAERTAAEAKLSKAVERLYVVFKKYPRKRKVRFGAYGDGKRFEDSMNRAPLRTLGKEHGLALFARDDDSLDKGDYKHFLPRLLENIEDLGAHNTLPVVEVLGVAVAAGLSTLELTAVRGWFLAYWEYLLTDPRTSVECLRVFFQCARAIPQGRLQARATSVGMGLATGKFGGIEPAGSVRRQRSFLRKTTHPPRQVPDLGRRRSRARAKGDEV